MPPIDALHPCLFVERSRRMVLRIDRYGQNRLVHLARLADGPGNQLAAKAFATVLGHNAHVN